jgi:hypothetical protein
MPRFHDLLHALATERLRKMQSFDPSTDAASPIRGPEHGLQAEGF